MYQIEWMRFFLCTRNFGQFDRAFHLQFVKTWWLSPVEDAVDALGCCLMGGEL